MAKVSYRVPKDAPGYQNYAFGVSVEKVGGTYKASAHRVSMFVDTDPVGDQYDTEYEAYVAGMSHTLDSLDAAIAALKARRAALQEHVTLSSILGAIHLDAPKI